MTIHREDGVIRLEGRCRIEEAETLLALLLDRDQPVVDLSQCGPLHTAVLQVLLAAKCRISGAPDDPFFRAHVASLLETNGSSSEAGH